LKKIGAPFAWLNIHAWLTLPTLEIIDMTFLTTNFQYFLNQGFKPWMKFVIGSREDVNTQMGLVYHPMLIGVNFFEKMGTVTKHDPNHMD
jgi:hypothetical protein